jgi:hypothetical protein
MQSKVTEISCAIELRTGEALRLPDEIVQIIGPGRWLVSIRPADHVATNCTIRDHSAFLNSFAPEDEKLYDDYSAPLADR